jgi:hypothetical protein
MEIKVEIDEARIIKNVISGMSKKQIEDNIIHELQQQIKSRVMDSVRDEVSEMQKDFSKRIKEDSMKHVREEVLAFVKERITPKKIASLIKGEDWKDYMEDNVGKVLSEFVERALSEWLQMSIVIKAKGSKPKEVSLAGVDSYTFRKK